MQGQYPTQENYAYSARSMFYVSIFISDLDGVISNWKLVLYYSGPLQYTEGKIKEVTTIFDKIKGFRPYYGYRNCAFFALF